MNIQTDNMKYKPDYLVQIYEIGKPLKKSINFSTINSFIGLYFDNTSRFKIWFDDNFLELKKLYNVNNKIVEKLDNYFYMPIETIATNIGSIIKFYSNIQTKKIEQQYLPTEIPVMTAGAFEKSEIIIFCIAIIFYLFSPKIIDINLIPLPQDESPNKNMYGGKLKLTDISGIKKDRRLIYIAEVKGYSVVLKITSDEDVYINEAKIYDELNSYMNTNLFLKDKVIKKYSLILRLEAFKTEGTTTKKYPTNTNNYPYNTELPSLPPPIIQDKYTTNTNNWYNTQSSPPIPSPPIPLPPVLSPSMLSSEVYKSPGSDKNVKILSFNLKNIKIGTEQFDIVIDDSMADFESIKNFYNDNFPLIFIVLEYRPTYYTLRNILRRLDSSNKCKLAQDVIKTLYILNKSIGFTHLDLHADNLLVDPTLLEFKLFDFDLSSTRKNKNDDLFYITKQVNFEDKEKFGLIYDVYRFMNALDVVKCSNNIIEVIANKIRKDYSDIKNKAEQKRESDAIWYVLGEYVAKSDIYPLLEKLNTDAPNIDPLKNLNLNAPIMHGGKNYYMKYIKYKDKYIKLKQIV